MNYKLTNCFAHDCDVIHFKFLISHAARWLSVVTFHHFLDLSSSFLNFMAEHEYHLVSLRNIFQIILQTFFGCSMIKHNGLHKMCKKHCCIFLFKTELIPFSVFFQESYQSISFSTEFINSVIHKMLNDFNDLAKSDIAKEFAMGNSERLKAISLAIPQFRLLPLNLIGDVWGKNIEKAIALMYLRMEAQPTALDQVFVMLKGSGSRHRWTDQFKYVEHSQSSL